MDKPMHTLLTKGLTTGALAAVFVVLAGGEAQAQTRPVWPHGGQPPRHLSGADQALGEDQVQHVLRSEGYSDVVGLERDGGVFKVKEAKRYGEKVENLRVDAITGEVRDQKRLSEDQVKYLLRDRGYSDVADVTRDGDAITARAKRDGAELRLRVDTRTGVVMPRQASG